MADQRIEKQAEKTDSFNPNASLVLKENEQKSVTKLQAFWEQQTSKLVIDLAAFIKSELPAEFIELPAVQQARALIRMIQNHNEPHAAKKTLKDYLESNSNFLVEIGKKDYYAAETLLVNSEVNGLLEDEQVIGLLSYHRDTLYNRQANYEISVEAPLLEFLLSRSGRSLLTLFGSENVTQAAKVLLEESSTIKACLDFFKDKKQAPLNELAIKLAEENKNIYTILNITPKEANYSYKIHRAFEEQINKKAQSSDQKDLLRNARDILLNCLARDFYDKEMIRLTKSSSFVPAVR